MELFKLFGSILVDSTGADSKIESTDKKAFSLGGTLGKVGGAAVLAGAALAGMAVAAGTAIFGLATNTAEVTDRIDKMSQKIGLSRKGFQEWDFIMSQSGSSVEVLQSGFKKFTGVMDDAVTGNKKATGAFKELGISTGELKKLSPEETFDKTIIALQNMPEGAHKSALANDLLGRSASELAPLINGAAGSVEEMRDKANELGLVLGDDAIDAGVVFTDSMDQIKRSVSAAFATIGAEVMPIVQTFLDWVMTKMPLIQGIMKTVFGKVGELVEIISMEFTELLLPALMELWGWIEPNIPETGNIFETAFNIIVEAIKLVTDAITGFIDIIGLLIDNWAIVEPILVGLAAAAVTFGLLTLAINAVGIAIGIWTAVTAAATVVATAFGAVMSVVLSPITLIAVAIGLLVAAGWLLYKNWDTVSAFLLGMWDAIKAAFEVSINAIMEFLQSTWTYIKDVIIMPVYNWFKDVLSKIWDVVSAAFITALDIIKTYISNKFQAIKAVIMPIYNWIKNVLSKIFSVMYEIFGVALGLTLLIIKAIWRDIKNVIMPYYNWLKNTLSAIWNVVSEAFDIALTAIKDFISTTWQGIKGVVLLYYNWLKNTFSKIWDVVSTAFITALDAIKTTISNKWQSIKGTILLYYNWLRDTFSLIWDVVKAAFTTALDLIKTKISTIWSNIKKAILPYYTWLKDTLGGVFSKVKSALDTAWGGIAKVVTGIWGGIKSAFKTGVNAVVGIVNGLISHINSIKISVPAVEVPGMGKFGGYDIGFPHIPQIPRLAKGGNIRSDGSVLVGENGAEILSGMKGARVTPLNKTGMVININNPVLFNDRDADKLGELIVNHLKLVGAV